MYASQMAEDAESQDKVNAFNRACSLYWIELVQIQVDTVYVERYRDWLTSGLIAYLGVVSVIMHTDDPKAITRAGRRAVPPSRPDEPFTPAPSRH
jgi:hypothetical protein